MWPKSKSKNKMEKKDITNIRPDHTHTHSQHIMFSRRILLLQKRWNALNQRAYTILIIHLYIEMSVLSHVTSKLTAICQFSFMYLWILFFAPCIYIWNSREEKYRKNKANKNKNKNENRKREIFFDNLMMEWGYSFYDQCVAKISHTHHRVCDATRHMPTLKMSNETKTMDDVMHRSRQRGREKKTVEGKKLKWKMTKGRVTHIEQFRHL